MCYKIESPFVLIHALKNRDSCSISDLFELKCKIEDALSSVYIDVTKKSILRTVLSYTDLFSLEDDVVTRVGNTDEYFKDADKINVRGYFKNVDIEKELELKIINYIENDE